MKSQKTCAQNCNCFSTSLYLLLISVDLLFKKSFLIYDSESCDFNHCSQIVFVIAESNSYIQVRMWRWLSLSGGDWWQYRAKHWKHSIDNVSEALLVISVCLSLRDNRVLHTFSTKIGGQKAHEMFPIFVDRYFFRIIWMSQFLMVSAHLALLQFHFVFRFFVLLIVYVIGGILVNKFKMGVESMPEMCPNYQFWAGIPSLIKVTYIKWY